MREWLEQLEARRPNEEWAAVSRVALVGWLCFYALFLFYAATTHSNFLILDHVNLVIHEAGHFFFGWFGDIIGILGGTLGELIVPLLCGVYFWWHRQTTGLTFCLFWFFENFLYIGTYMADARRLSLPLVGSGDHDWEILFTHWNVLHLDQVIGGRIRTLGWLGMIATIAWLLWTALRRREEV